jgi:hypothetical protein
MFPRDSVPSYTLRHRLAVPSSSTTRRTTTEVVTIGFWRWCITFRNTLSKGPNRIGVFSRTWGRKQIQFPKRRVSLSLFFIPGRWIESENSIFHGGGILASIIGIVSLLNVSPRNLWNHHGAEEHWGRGSKADAVDRGEFALSSSIHKLWF